MPRLWWLPTDPDWKSKVKAVDKTASWSDLKLLAQAQCGFSEMLLLDRRLAKLPLAEIRPAGMDEVRLAILASNTVDHLLPGLRIAALRQDFHLHTYLTDFGQYEQELLDPNSKLYAFKPDVVLFSQDSEHLFGTGSPETASEAAASVQAALNRLRSLWGAARKAFGCQVVQQAVLPVAPSLMGNNEHRLPSSRNQKTRDFNNLLRGCSDQERVDILAVDDQAVQDGLGQWHDPALWYRAKQEIGPFAADYYGDLLLRIIKARRGRSSKCLVLDLDNTLWGGVIGDDGLEGITLGQGCALGEAYIQFQNFAKNLSRRGIILAVCSKNDEANAKSPFEKHPDMVIKLSDIACFVANWDDKATNMRRIAKQLNIGLDALVFADDNPFERNIVRRELPMVAVPELPEDPAFFAKCISDAGYFESVEITAEDLGRTQLYQAAEARTQLRENSTDLDGYLSDLAMKLTWRSFDQIGLQRIVQLINKTNQFNLTTRRYREDEVVEAMAAPDTMTLQIRLADKFADHGMVAVIMGKKVEDRLEIDTWLMSCRVLGRGVEEACGNLVMEHAHRMGASSVTGLYKPTAKNEMVAQHYAKLGFEKVREYENGETRWILSVSGYVPRPTHIEVNEG